jgi:hypothetical protein
MKTTNTYWWRPGLYLRAVFVAGLLGLMLASWGLAADIAKKVAVDAVGNVYVTGKSDNIVGNSDYVTIKYDANGNWLWGRRYNGTGHGNDTPYALAADTAGNVYVTGESPSATGSSDYVTIKYDTNGNWLWGRRYDSPYHRADVAQALAVDAAGNVYVTGYTGNETNTDYVTIKYDANGNWLWGRRYDGPDFLPR